MASILNLVTETGVVRMRASVSKNGQAPYCPRMCLWADQKTGMILHTELAEPMPDYLPLLAQSLEKLAKRIGGLPRQILLRDPTLARELRAVLEPTGVEVAVRESLPMLDAAVASLGEFKALSGKRKPGLLDVPGMSLDHVIAFAEAAKLFYEARPWRHLTDDDLIEVVSPPGPKGTQFTQVLGAGGQAFGLGFVASRQAHEDMRSGAALPRGSVWNFLYAEFDDLPFEDGDAWERYNLPVAGPEAYPAFARFAKSRGFAYPKAEELVWAEGLLRALAASTEDEFDRAHWEKEVDTFAGRTTYRFSMPILLEQMSGTAAADRANIVHSGRMAMEQMMRALGQQIAGQGPLSGEQLQSAMKEITRGKAPQFVPTTDAERAQALCYQAHEARGRRQVQLARQALQIDPDCCEAMFLLAERVSDPEHALPLYQKAIEAARRQLGEKLFTKEAGHFWGIIETRPYMRARHMLGMTLMNLNRFEEAAEHFQDMLRLNPGDNQGIRYALAQCLLLSDRLDELDELLNRSKYRHELSPEWAFTKVLLAYRRFGDSPQAKSALSEAQKSNEFVVALLTGRKAPSPLAALGMNAGRESEAVSCVEEISEGWYATPDALEWLESVTAPQRKRKKKPK